jgi:SAM-dependent methyltransferase
MLERARTFDAVAGLYDEMRPRYPDALFDDLADLSGVATGADVLEIGTGPGVATRPLAERGYRVVGLEPGPALAATARQNLVDLDRVEIRQTTFEDAELDPASFDLVVSASAWHWVDPEVGLDKAADVLRPGGALAIWWGHGQLTDPAFEADSNAIHREWAPGLVDRRLSAQQGRRAQHRDRIADHPAFGPLQTGSHPFEISYDSTAFVRLLDTYSHYRLLDDDDRRHLFDALAELIDTRYDGHVSRRYESVLYVAPRLAAPI